MTRTNNSRRTTAFTIIELIIVMVLIGILAIIGLVAYNNVQQRASDSTVQTTVTDALKHLQLFYVENRSYPSNIANTQYAPPLNVALALYTNAAQTPTYQNLTADQNAQLFLNACNGYMPIVSGGTTYNTSCVYSGNNAHIKGQVGSNVVISGPNFNQSDFVLTCGSACSTVQSNIISSFTSQGGSFPITVPKSGSSLPAPVLVTTGVASKFCLEGRSPQFSSVVYHVVPSSSAPESGPCPTDPTLHYP
ncbi:MAG: type II secretion system protein [Candidatus Saccharimonas aalborgensis]